MYRSTLAVGMALLLTATASSAQDAPSFNKKAITMTPEQFVVGTTIEDDALEHAAVISTEFAPRKGKKQTRLVDDRTFLRAVIDKSTGAVSYEVNQAIRYRGLRRDYQSVQYLTPAGLREARLTDARHGLDDCINYDLSPVCWLSKHMSFTIGEADLKAIAAGYRAGEPGNFVFKFKDNSGIDYSSGLVAAEVAGLLTAVENYRQSNPAVPRAPVS